MASESNEITNTYNALLKYYGEQAWWPSEDAFEVLIGAILTQNTAWTNVEKAINNLKQHQLCNSQSLLNMKPEKLAPYIRSSGYYNQKAQRLIAFSHWYHEQGGFEKLYKMDTEALRDALLSINGIGHETADDMLLYAFEKSSFVIDAYTRRLFSRLELIPEKLGYNDMQALFHQALDDDIEVYKQYHALIVSHAKKHCMKKPQCAGCPLIDQCGYTDDTR